MTSRRVDNHSAAMKEQADFLMPHSAFGFPIPSFLIPHLDFPRVFQFRIPPVVSGLLDQLGGLLQRVGGAGEEAAGEVIHLTGPAEAVHGGLDFLFHRHGAGQLRGFAVFRWPFVVPGSTSEVVTGRVKTGQSFGLFCSGHYIPFCSDAQAFSFSA